MPVPLLLDLFTDGSLQATALFAGTAHFTQDSPPHALFDIFCARWCDSPLLPIDEGIAGRLVAEERVPNVGEGQSIKVDAPSVYWRKEFALPFGGRVDVTYRVYEQERANGPDALVRTHELVFAPAGTTHPTEQPAVHSGYLFACGPLGFALVAGDALSAFAQQVNNGDLLERFTTTEDATAFLERGDFLPVLGIHMWTYRMIVSPLGLQDHEQALLGTRVLGPRRYRVNVGPERRVELVDGESLRHFRDPRVLRTLTWPLTDRDVNFAGFTTGGHGDGLVPTYLLEPGAESRPLSEACINEDLGTLYDRGSVVQSVDSRDD